MIFPLENIYADFMQVNVVVAVIYVVIGLVIAKIMTLYIRKTLKGKVPEYAIAFTNKIVFYMIILISVISALLVIGAEKYITGLIVAGGVLGVILGFASQQAVSNFISGIFLLVDRPMTVGDPVEVEKEAGIVTDISFLSTRIRTWDGKHVRFPNSKVFTSKIINYGKHVIRRVDLVVGVAYKEDPEKVIDIIKKVVNKHPLVLMEPPPIIFVDSLGESSVNVSVRVWTPTREYFTVRTQLASMIKKGLEEAGIEIPFPQTVIWFKTPLKIEQ